MKMLLIFLFSLSLFSSDYEEHSDKHINKELSHLKLTKEQKGKIKSILKVFRGELKEYRELKKEIDKQRKEIFLKEKFEIERVNKLNTKLDAKAHEIENHFLKKVHSLLNKQQRINFIHYFDDWEVE